MSIDDLKHAQRERIIFLDRCLTWRGAANRRDLVEQFGLSTAQAALDFRVYLNLVATKPDYDPARKTYLAASDHKPLSPSTLTEAFDVVAGHNEELVTSILPRPERVACPEVIARLYQVMRSGRALQFHYTSMSSGRAREQWVAPTRFTSDGESVHCRAFSFEHREYRNYLPIRIDPDSSFDEKAIDNELPEDSDWYTKAIIWLQPSAQLSKKQAEVVRREYGFESKLLRVETRKALEFFFNRRWGLEEPGARLERVKTEYEPGYTDDADTESASSS